MTGAPANDIEGIVPDEVKRERYRAADGSGAGHFGACARRRRSAAPSTCWSTTCSPKWAAPSRRSQWDAPEIDGTVIIHEAEGIKPGDMVSVTVTDSDEYDLFGVPAARCGTLTRRVKFSA